MNQAMIPSDCTAFRIGDWRVEPALDEIARDGVTAKLEPRRMRVLVCLAEHAGEVVSVEDLLDVVWKDVIVTHDSVYQAVAGLRRALGDDQKNPIYIANVQRRGYRLIAPVAAAEHGQIAASRHRESAPYVNAGWAQHPEVIETAPASHDRLAAVQAPVEPGPRLGPPATNSVAAQPAARSRPTIVARVLAAILAVALAYFVVDKFWLSKRAASSNVNTTVAGGRTSRAVPETSIAVLALANESSDASQQYFSDGISEDLITALSQFPGLKVIGRSSAFQFRDSNEDSRSIGAKLGVAHLLEGSVRRSGEMVRVSAELIDTADGSTQWSEHYDRPYKDLFALQDEITHAVAEALRTKLLPGEHAAAQSERPPGGSLEAYNVMLQGRFYYFRSTEADIRQAIEYHRQAIELDPRYALAWSELSRSWAAVGAVFLEGAGAQAAYAKAREAADRALTLSPGLADGHLARGYLLQNADFNWRGAEAEYRRALALAPNDGEAKFRFGNLLAIYGELETAIELTQQALVTEPLRAGWYQWLAIYLSGLNRLDDAERAIRRAIELQPGAAAYHTVLAAIEVQRSNAQAALEAAEQEPPGYWQDTALALARQSGGDRSAADAALRTLIEKYAGIAAYQVAEVYALRNDAKATFEWLDRAWSNRDGGISHALYDPFIVRYKDDPRFAAFCRKVGLPTPAEVAAHKT